MLCKSAIVATEALLLGILFLIGTVACTSEDPCLGFRDAGVPPPDLPYTDVADGRARQPDGRPAILIIGDSFTYGAGVSENETIAAHLEGALNEHGQDYQVVNLGIKGYNLPLALERLRAMHQSYPDSRLVLFEYHSYDYYPASSAVNDPHYSSFAKSVYLALFVHYFHPEPDWITGLRARFIESDYRRWIEQDDIRLQLLECNVRKPLYEIVPWLEQEDLALAIFPLPFNGNPEAEAILKKFAEDSTRVTYLPVDEAIASQMTEEEHLRDERLPDNHLNSAGYARISRELLRQLIDAGFLDGDAQQKTA